MLVVIVVAGITGLTVAVEFRRYNHTVDVYERKTEQTFASEGGAGIQLQPNAMRVLTAWNIDTTSIAGSGYGTEICRYDTGEIIARHLPHSEDQWYMIRSDFRRLMNQAAKDIGANIHFDKIVHGVNVETPSVTFTNGQTVSANFMIAADGIRSSVRQHLFPGTQARPVPQYSFNIQLKFSDIPDEVRQKVTSTTRSTIIIGPERALVTCPIHSSQIMDMQFLILDYEFDEDSHPETWNEHINGIEIVRECYSDYHETFQQLLQLGKECWKWLFAEAFPDTWISSDGRIVLAGDSAHAMVPHVGQGGTQCIEDAAALSELYRNVSPSNPRSIVRRAEAYQDLRFERTRKARERARLAGMTWGLTDSNMQRKRDAGLKRQENLKTRVEGDRNAKPNSIAFEVWLENYNVLEEARQVVRRLIEPQAKL